MAEAIDRAVASGRFLHAVAFFLTLDTRRPAPTNRP
jgi:hypothetical protein